MLESNLPLRVLFNAHSLSQRPRMWVKIEKYIQKHRLDWQMVEPRMNGLEAQALGALEAGVKRLAIVGGDGSVHQMAGLLAGSDCVLGIVPGGTGNDFCRTAGIPGRLTAALDVLRTGRDRRIDLGRCNGISFINVAGMGFDAQVVKNAIPYKAQGLISSRAYLRSVFYTLKHMEYHPILAAEGLSGPLPEKMLLVAAGNGHYIGGGMKITPLAALDDGLLDICLVSDVKLGRFIQLFPGFLRGRHLKVKDVVRYEKVKRLSLGFDQPIPMQLDGELFEADHFDVEILPAALTLRMPAN